MKHPITFICLAAFLFFAAGCPPQRSEPAEQPTVETVKPQPIKPETVQTQPSESEPAQAKLPEPEPIKTQPPEPEPVQTQPSETEAVKAEPSETETPKTEPAEPEPAKPETAEPEPAEEKPQEAEPAKAEPNGANLFHDKCAQIFTTYVDNKGKVDYKTLKRNRLELIGLLGEFSKLDPKVYNSWPNEDKIAFWLNVYNTELLKIIVDNYPIESSRVQRIFWPPDSIRHIQGIWSRKFIVMDEEFTLAEIDERFFRKAFDEPRIFFGISYASFSSPPLRNEPYYGSKLYEQLDDQVKKFLAGDQAVKIEDNNQTVYLSAILKSSWYGKEFINKYGTDKKFKDQEPPVRAVLNFLINYLPEKDVTYLETGVYTVKYINYNWRLNEQP